jgi:hypothetical protein
MYHYFEADDIFALIRCFVSAYVWMTGFGNGFYFWFKNEQRDGFTFARFAQSIWRINFLVVPLSLATATDWILYYVVMLHTLHFVMVFICLFLASVLSRRFGWSHTNREIALGIGLYFILIVVVWEIPGLFQSTIEAACRAIFGDFFAEYLTYRTTIDKWSSFAGLVFAAFYPNIKSMYVQQKFTSSNLGFLSIISFAAFGFWLWAWRVHTAEEDYAQWHPYTGTLWVLSYVLLRNAYPGSSHYVSVPLEMLGTYSLELYLLQFHIYLAKKAARIMLILPPTDCAAGYHRGLNMALTTVLYIFAARCCFGATSALNTIACGTHTQTSCLLVMIAVVLGLVAYALNSECHVNGWSITFAVALAFLYRVYVLWVERNANLAKQTEITTPRPAGSRTSERANSMERKEEGEEREGGLGLGIEDKEGASVGVEHTDDSMMDAINAVRNEKEGQDPSRPSVEVKPGAVRSGPDIWKKWIAVGITVTILFLSMYSICDFDTPVSANV